MIKVYDIIALCEFVGCDIIDTNNPLGECESKDSRKTYDYPVTKLDAVDNRVIIYCDKFADGKDEIDDLFAMPVNVKVFDFLNNEDNNPDACIECIWAKDNIINIRTTTNMDKYLQQYN